MAKYWTNRGRLRLSDGGINGATTRQLVAFKGTAPSQATITKYNFLSDLAGAMTELTGSTYARATSTFTLAQDNTNDRVTMTYSTSPSLGSGIPTGETITAIAFINQAGGADSARELYWVDVLAAGLPTNGSAVQYNSAVDTMA